MNLELLVFDFWVCLGVWVDCLGFDGFIVWFADLILLLLCGLIFWWLFGVGFTVLQLSLCGFAY